MFVLRYTEYRNDGLSPQPSEKEFPLKAKTEIGAITEAQQLWPKLKEAYPDEYETDDEGNPKDLLAGIDNPRVFEVHQISKLSFPKTNSFGPTIY